MDFKELLFDFLISIIIVLRRFIFLIFSPYKTIRKISLDGDYKQIVIIIFFIFFYFQIAYRVRPVINPILTFLVFMSQFSATILFFYWVSNFFNKEGNLYSYIMTFSYSLFPTLIWFLTNSILYFVLPPPRTLSLLGKAFSIFFIAFSISLAAWKLILVYLSLRFSTRLGFYRIIYFLLLYLCLFIPYSFLLYQLKIFRIPFI